MFTEGKSHSTVYFSGYFKAIRHHEDKSETLRWQRTIVMEGQSTELMGLYGLPRGPGNCIGHVYPWVRLPWGIHAAIGEDSEVPGTRGPAPIFLSWGRAVRVTIGFSREHLTLSPCTVAKPPPWDPFPLEGRVNKVRIFGDVNPP